jgi:hypothetical protein
MTQSSRKQSAKSSPWREPTVITAIIAGVFGALYIVLKSMFPEPARAPAPAPTPVTVAAPEASAVFDFSVTPVSARLTEIQRALAHRVADKPQIETRQRAITALVTLSGEQPPETYYAQAVEMLTRYVKDNISERRAPGDQVEVDPRGPTYRPLDIIAAIQGLQVIRRGRGESVKVLLGAVDFRQINLEKLDLEGFYFGHADFSGANLSDCQCRGADFRHARFRGTAIWGTTRQPADFRNANFLQADLAGSKWANVDFTGSNIETAVGHQQVELLADWRGLTSEQLALFPKAGKPAN